MLASLVRSDPMDECSSDNDDVPGDLDENDSYSQGSSQVASQASAIASSVVGIIDYPQWHTTTFFL